MKTILLLLISFFPTYISAQNSSCDSIVWSKDHKLTWDDFKAIPDTSAKDAAQSFIRLHKSWKLRKDSVTIRISNYFKPCVAWSKLKASDTLLWHEQGHFDISEYFRRLFIKRCNAQNFERDSLRSEIESIGNDVEAQQQEFVALYESKTNFGRDKLLQVEWSSKILQLIDSLKGFDLLEIRKPVIQSNRQR